MSDETEVRKLPVWRTVKASYLVISHNWELAIKLAWIPLFFLTVPMLVHSYFRSGMTIEEISTLYDHSTMEALLMLLILFAELLSQIPMITAWHRLVILGRNSPQSSLVYSIRTPEWTYLRVAIALLVIFVLVILSLGFASMLFGGLFSAASHGFGTIFAVLSVLAVIAVTSIFLRLSLALPAAAIGEPIRFRESFTATKENTWRIAAVFSLSWLPPAILMMIAAKVIGATVGYDPESDIQPEFANQVVFSVINAPLWVISVCVGTSVWSWCYRFFIQGQPIALPGEQ